MPPGRRPVRFIPAWGDLNAPDELEARVLDLADITIGDFAVADIDGFLAYWYDSGADHLAAMGVDPAKLPSRRKMREMLEWNIERDRLTGSKRNAIVSIKLKGETIGVHELTHLSARDDAPEGSYADGVMHAHIWRAEHRHLGLGLVSYVKAMQAFFDRFALDAILFESPADNPAANKIKTRLGIEAVGEGRFDLPILRTAVRSVRYRVTPADMPAIGARMERIWRERGNTVRS